VVVNPSPIAILGVVWQLLNKCGLLSHPRKTTRGWPTRVAQKKCLEVEPPPKNALLLLFYFLDLKKKLLMVFICQVEIF
jgi:hypothetical protein